MTHVIDGNTLAERLEERISESARALTHSGVAPGLATVLIGEDYGSMAYERRLGRLAERVHVRYVSEQLPADVELADVLATVGKLNADPRVTGILILRPLPRHIPEVEVYRTLDPLKDIEAVHPSNAGLLAMGRPRFTPSTPAACFYILDQYMRENKIEGSPSVLGKVEFEMQAHVNQAIVIADTSGLKIAYGNAILEFAQKYHGVVNGIINDATSETNSAFFSRLEGLCRLGYGFWAGPAIWRDDLPNSHHYYQRLGTSLRYQLRLGDAMAVSNLRGGWGAGGAGWAVYWTGRISIFSPF